jgi:hypothetical protein
VGVDSVRLDEHDRPVGLPPTELHQLACHEEIRGMGLDLHHGSTWRRPELPEPKGQTAGHLAHVRGLDQKSAGCPALTSRQTY